MYVDGKETNMVAYMYIWRRKKGKKQNKKQKQKNGRIHVYMAKKKKEKTKKNKRKTKKIVAYMYIWQRKKNKEMIFNSACCLSQAVAGPKPGQRRRVFIFSGACTKTPVLTLDVAGYFGVPSGDLVIPRHDIYNVE
jgi:hypothetical protein